MDIDKKDTAVKKVKLTSSDDKSFLIDRDVAEMSGTLKNMLEDVPSEGDVPEIPLPSVTAQTLEKVIEYLEYHKEHPSPPRDEDDKEEEYIIPWDNQFCKVKQELLFDLILTANFLDIKPLLVLVCRVVALSLRGKTTQEIREIFNIKNDFTPEEEALISSSNCYCEENPTDD